MTSFADCFIRLRVDKSQLRTDAEAGIKSAKVQQAGTKAGTSWARGFHLAARKESIRLSKGIAGGAGPGIGKLGAARASMLGLGAAGLGAIPAIAAVAATGAIAGLGTSVIGTGAKLLIGTKQAPGVLFAQATAMAAQFKKVATQAAGGMLAPLKKAFSELGGPGGIIAGLEKPLHQLFAGAGTLIMPLLHGLTEIAHVALPLLGQAFRAVSKFVGPLLHGVAQLLAGLLPGLIKLLQAAQPAIKVIVDLAVMAGRQLGGMFASFAPVIKSSSLILKGLAELIGGLLPIIGKLAVIMAKVLGPVFVTVAGVIKSMLPVLIIVGRIIAGLAKAILGDLASALGAVATVIKGIMPALHILVGALSGVFKVLENSGVFAILGNALEAVAPLIARLVSALITGLAPILPVVLKLVSQLGGIAIQVLSVALRAVLPLLIMLIKAILVPILPLVKALAPLILLLGKLLGVILVTAVKLLTPVLKIVIVVLGFIVKVIAAVITWVLRLATHWKGAWRDIVQWAKDAWQFLTHGWGQFLIPGLTLIRKVVEFVRDHWKQAWADIQQAALTVGRWLWTDFGAKIVHFFTGTLPGAFRTAVSLIGRVWTALKTVLTAPVRFVIDNVIDGLISAFDWISSKVGGPQIKPIHPFGLAKGGIVPGHGSPTADNVLIAASSGETMLSVAHSRMLAPLLGLVGVPGYAKGGRVGQHPPNKPAGGPGGLLGGIFDAGRIMAALFSGNTVALSHAIADLLPTGLGGATGAMAGMLTAIPRALLGTIAKYLIGTAGIPNASNIVRYAMSWIGRVPYVWGGTALPGGADCSGYTGAVYRHFGIIAPRTSEEQFGWARRTPPRAGGLAFYISPAGGAPPGHVAIVKDARTVISQGGGIGPQLMPLHAMPLMGTGVPPLGRRTGVPSRFHRGGWLTEAIAGVGLQSGNPYAFAAGEGVTTGGGLEMLAGLLTGVIHAIRQNSGDTADGVAAALGSAARTSMYRAEYSPRG